MTTDPSERPREEPRAPWARARLRDALPPFRGGLRLRILAWFIGVLALATIASVLVTREVLLHRLDQRIDRELVQESAELRRLARGNDPRDGRPFGARARRIFEVFLERNVPSRGEALITFVDGEPYLRSRPVVPYRLDRDPVLVERWASLEAPERGRAGTPAGEVEYLAVPLLGDGEVRGTFVAAVFRDRAADDVNGIVGATASVGFAFLLVGSLLAWRLADRVLRPISELERTSRRITETDLTRRIPVRGNDEVAQLARTYNEMLDRLERAFASQRAFLDDAGHELKTPLTIVRGHLELLEDDPAEREATLALVTDEIDRMGRIVDDLLLLAKREQPGFLRLETVDVEAFTNDLHAKVEALAPREWVLERRGRGVIVADGQRLTQALVQLAANAARHAPGDEPITLGSTVENGEARFWVSDRGPGIAPEERDRIFDRFTSSSASGRADGAGLGLPIVRSIAEAHHGHVAVESRPGGGSTFTLVVPVDQPSREEDNA